MPIAIYMSPPRPCPLLSSSDLSQPAPAAPHPAPEPSPEEMQRNFNRAVQAAIDELTHEYGLVATHITHAPRRPA